MFEVNVSAGGSVPSSRARGPPEVGRKCTKFESARSAGGRLEVYQVRELTTTTNARREVLFTHCGLKVHSHYSV